MSIPNTVKNPEERAGRRELGEETNSGQESVWNTNNLATRKGHMMVLGQH